MERLLKTFHKDFHEFCGLYKQPSLIYHKTIPSDSHLDSSYIAGEIRSKLHELSNVVVCDRIRIYYKKVPKYMLEFLVFYISFLKYTLAKVSPSRFDVNVNVFMSPFKKVFPKQDGAPLTPLNVNSGVTFYNTSGFTEKHVVVYRQEEVFKVLMHELIHAYELDIPRMSTEVEKPIRTIFGKVGVILRVNESLTDTLACLFNVIMYCILKKQSSLKEVRKQLGVEQTYILSKGFQVFRWEGYRYENDIKVPHLNMHEHTHVTSYYILKALNFWNLSKFLDLSRPYDETLYITHLQEVIQDPRFWRSFTKLHEKTNSLRMSKTDIIDIVYGAKSKLLKTLLTK